MIKKVANWYIKRKTKNLTRIPLFTVTFDYQKYIKDGAAGTCSVYLHPVLDQHDTELLEMFREPIEYIRANYDMEKFTKI